MVNGQMSQKTGGAVLWSGEGAEQGKECMSAEPPVTILCLVGGL